MSEPLHPPLALVDSVSTQFPSSPPQLAFTTLEQLDQLIQAGDWGTALDTALAGPSPSPLPHSTLASLAQHHLLSLPSPSHLTLSQLDRLFALVAPVDPLWTAAALLRVLRASNSTDLASRAADYGLKALDRAIALPSLTQLSDAIGEQDWVQVEELARDENGEAGRTVRARRAFLELADRVMTWEAIWDDSKGASVAGGSDQGRDKGEEKDEEKDEEEDGWADDLDLDLPGGSHHHDGADEHTAAEDEPAPRAPSPPPAPSPSTPSRPSLSDFLTRPLLSTALSLAASSSLAEVALLCTLHSASLYPHRISIVESVPEWVDPGEYLTLLPAVDARGREAEWEDVQPWRSSADWSESLSLPSPSPSSPPPSSPTAEPRPADALTAWYLSRATAVADLGLVHPALALVQHAAARGVMGLDAVGEELSLLSRLVYDRPSPPPIASTSSSHSPEEAEEPPLTLAYYRSLSPLQIIALSVAPCSPANLASTVRRLVLPYLGVLESRQERAEEGSGEGLARRLLNEWVLTLPAETKGGKGGEGGGMARLLALFEASKPTLPLGARILANDADLARLALACLYGAGGEEGRAMSEEEVVAMGRVFECLPAFSDAVEGEEGEGEGEGEEKVDLFALSRPPALPAGRYPTPTHLFSAPGGLATAPPPALSPLLDTLDLHLSLLESFHRFSLPLPLSWFLVAHDDKEKQRRAATRLARTAAAGGSGGWRGGEGREGEFESEDEWEGLMEFMAECTGVAGASTEEEEEEERKGGKEKRDEKGLGRAFWRLGREEVLRIFFGGLLGAGRFSLARSLFAPSSGAAPPPLEPGVVEQLVVEASREFYDNAEEGSLHRGEMKMAYECLSAAPQQTPLIRRERAFIEATSRLCSFRLPSPSTGLPLVPHELRHAPDRLGLVALLLAHNPDASKHPEMVLELVWKLGYPHGGVAEVRTLAMLADAAVGMEEWATAAEMTERAAAVVEALRKRRGRSISVSTSLSNEAAEDQDADAAAEYAWKAAFQLGKHAAWTDVERRKEAVGRALVLCPPERIAAILPLWTELEREVAVRQAERAREGKEGRKSALGGGGGGGGVNLDLAQAGAAVEKGAAKVANFLAAAAASASAAPSARATPSPVPQSPRRSETPQHQQQHQQRDLAAEAAEAASRTFKSAAAYLPSAFSGAVVGAMGRSPPASPSRSSAARDQQERARTPTSPVRPASTAAAEEKQEKQPIGPVRKSKLGAKPVRLGAVPASSSASSSSLPSPRRSSAAPSSTPPPPALARTPSPPSRFAAAFDSPPSRFAGAFDALASSPPASSRAAYSHPHHHPQQQHPQPAQPFSSGFGLRAGLSNKLTAGVGWLIGADEMMEEQAREREVHEEQRRRREEEEREREREGGTEEQKEEDEGWGW
ncbi:hypothetical protein JCM8097_003338 [Rhodosporidiobolus ruineniae]